MDGAVQESETRISRVYISEREIVPENSLQHERYSSI